MTDNITCESHNDCDFFDCKGQCDLITNKCTKGVVNNNLQVKTRFIYYLARFQISIKDSKLMNYSYSKHKNIMKKIRKHQGKHRKHIRKTQENT